MANEAPLNSDDIAKYYRHQFDGFRTAVQSAFFVCYGISDLLVLGARPKYRGILFTKLCVTGRSLLLLAPDPTDRNFHRAHMDLSGGAALARVVIDTFVSLFHLGLDRCGASEFEARELLAYWRDLQVRKRMSAVFDGAAVVAARSPVEDELRARLGDNSHFAGLPEKRRRHLLKKADLLYAPEDILKQAGFPIEQVRGFYAYLSAHAHCDSVSFMSMPEQRRGRGFPSDADMALLGTCLEQAGIFVSEGARLVELAAPGAEARGRSIDGLDPLRDVAGPQWWQGKKLSEIVPGARDD